VGYVAAFVQRVPVGQYFGVAVEVKIIWHGSSSIKQGFQHPVSHGNKAHQANRIH
jgi:hypothetical protein